MPNIDIKNHINVITDSITMTANQGFVELIADLTAIIDAMMGGTDGESKHIKRITFHLNIGSTTTESIIGYPFAVQPVIVQCSSGTLADGVDIAITSATTLATLLDGQCSDDFGYQKIGSLRRSKPLGAAFANDRIINILRTSIQIPQNIIALLNKEQNSERLQSLHLGLVGIVGGGFPVLGYTAHYEIDFSEKRKGITIR